MTTHGFWDEVFCAEHGWASHVVIHEAAHAVYAVNHGIDFSEVRIEAPEAFLGLVDGTSALAGGVLVRGAPKDWIPERSETALDFLLIGRVAELGFFKHSLSNSDVGDRALWFLGTGSPATPEQLASSRARAKLEVERSEKAIIAIAREFSKILGTESDGTYSGFNDALVISAAEVTRVVSESNVQRERAESVDK